MAPPGSFYEWRDVAVIPSLQSEGQVLAEVNGCLGLITLNRPQALNALSLAMIR